MRTQLVLWTVVVILGAPAHGVVLSEDGRARATIVVAESGDAAVATAAAELAVYLERVTGGRFEVVRESIARVGEARIFVGPTAAGVGVDAAQMGSEQWLVRTAGEDLYLVGGSPRGTLYAVYHFLEDVVGVHWWNPWEETVPRQPTLRVGPLDLQGRPAFRYRDIYMLYGHDGGRFAARNRLNREGDAPIEGRYGGSVNYGPPYHVHTFFHYFPPTEYFNKHPEWYSLIDGQRKHEGAQLCLSNAALRKEFLAKLIANIEASREKARARRTPPPLVFSISQNDCAGPCQCEPCAAIAHAEGSEAGPLLSLVNFLADGIRGKYPEVYLDTLAYQYTQAPPRNLKLRDNVIIRLCDTEADMLRPVTHPNNARFRELLTEWSRLARNLCVWDYAITYGTSGMPLPTAHTFGPDYQFYLAHHVEGVFTELEDEILADMRDWKVWVMMKLLEDPGRDFQSLMQTFTDGFYGAAGGHVREYLTALQTAMETRGARSTCWDGSPQKLTYLDLDFVVRAEGMFDRAEAAIGDDPVLRRRVRHARLPLDRAVLLSYPRLRSAWASRGGEASRMPLDRDAIAKRTLSTWIAQVDLRIPGSQRASQKAAANAEMGRMHLLPTTLARPEKFRDLPQGKVIDYTAETTRNWGGVVKIMKDPEAESGVTNRLLLSDEKPENRGKYGLPMAWGLYDVEKKRGFGGRPIEMADVPGPGYHWYRMGAFRLAHSYYLYFFWSWIIQIELDDAVDANKPDQEYEVWARVKFEGPMFPFGRREDADAIHVERVVLVRR